MRVEDGSPIFSKSDIGATFADILRECALRNDCLIPVYCFMPKHLHVLIKGTKESSDTWRTITQFKQRTGYWLSKHTGARWQRNFFDRILRRDDVLSRQVWYIVNNPVRRGMVEKWEDYPYTGSIGFDLKELLGDLQIS